MSLLNHLRQYRGPEAPTLDAYFDHAKQEAWNRVRETARVYVKMVDAAAIEVAVRRRAEAPGSFFALLLDVAFRDPERRTEMVALFRKHLAEHPGDALGAAGYNLHEYHPLLDARWIADARAHFDADPEGAWGIVKAAAMYEPHCLAPGDIDWFEARRVQRPYEYFVAMFSLNLVPRALRVFGEHPVDAVEAAAFAGYEKATPELMSAVLQHFESKVERAWEFFDRACREKAEFFDDALLDALDARAVAGAGKLFDVLKHLVDKQSHRAGALLDRYVALMRRHPRECVHAVYYNFQGDDVRLLNPGIVQAACAGFEYNAYNGYSLLIRCLRHRPELIGRPEIEAAIANIAHATNFAFDFFEDVLRARPEFTRECTLALFECVAQEPVNRADVRAREMSSIIAISEAAHIRTGLENALREPPRVGSRRARALMAIMFRQKSRAHRHVLLEALRHAASFVLWHQGPGGESEKFSPIWDFLMFIIDNAADDAISTAAAERFLEGAFQQHFLCANGAEHEKFLRGLDTVAPPAWPLPPGTEFLDKELVSLYRLVCELGRRVDNAPRISAFDKFAGRLAAAEEERRVLATKPADDRLRTRLAALDFRIACWRDPEYARAFTDAEAERRLSPEARSLLRREKKDLAKHVRDDLRAEAIRIAVAAVDKSRLDLYRGRLRDVLGHDVDIATIEPRILPSFLWFQAIRGFPRNTKYLRRLIEDRIANRAYDWLRTEPEALAWAERVRAAQPAAVLDRWRAPFSRDFNYRPKDARSEKKRRIKDDLAQVRALLEKAGVKPASDTLSELRAKLDEAREADGERPAAPASVVQEIEQNLERVRIIEQTPESDFEGRITLSVETDPFEVLFMGEYGFASCLSLRGSNAWSSVSNAIDIDKAIVWAKEPNGNVVGRRLLALMPEGVVQFRTYMNRHGLALDGFFDEFVEAYASHCGVPLARGGHPRPLLSDKWYDDGAI